MSARNAGERGFRLAAEHRDTEEDELGPPGPIVVLIADGGAFAVLIDPALPCGNHRRSCPTKQDAWHEARELWSQFRLGFSDRTSQGYGRSALNK